MSYLERFEYRQGMRGRFSEEEIGSLLTDRQREVLRLVAAGLSNKAIGKKLGITLPTVESHLTKPSKPTGIYRRLNAFSRTEAVIKAIALGIIEAEELVTEEEIERCRHLTNPKHFVVLQTLSNPQISFHKATEIIIAEETGISRYMVKRYLHEIYGRLGIEGKQRQIKSTHAAVIYLVYEQRKLTSPYHGRFRESNAVDDW